MGNIDDLCTDPTGSPTAHDPTPGIIGVANYDGSGLIHREGDINPSSSEGFIDNQSTWPDVAAPGTSITSTATVGGAVTGLPNGYATATGTSMATPHVAGIVALLLQAQPSLTPAQVESVLEKTAYPFNEQIDPVVGHYKMGHGLVDAYKALHALKGAGADDGVQAMSVKQARAPVKLTRTSTPSIHAGDATVRGDVFVQTGALRRYTGDAHLYQGGLLDPFVLTGLVASVDTVVAAGEPVDIEARSVASVGGLPLGDGQATRFTVVDAAGATVLSAEDVISGCASECVAAYSWTVPETAAGNHRLFIEASDGTTFYPVTQMDFYVVGAPGTPSVPELTPAPEAPYYTPAPAGTPLVQVRFAGGDWVDAKLDDDGVHWKAKIAVPDVVTNDALLEVQATQGDVVKRDAVLFTVDPIVSVEGPASGVVDQSLTFTATVAKPGTYTYEWDADYDGVTFSADGTGATFTTSYATPGTRTVAARVLDGSGHGAIRTVQVAILHPVVLLDVTQDQDVWVPDSLVFTQVGFSSLDAWPYFFDVPMGTGSVHVSLDWQHYEVVSSDAGVTANDFDLWFYDPAGNFDSHGGASSNWGERVDLAQPMPGSWEVDVTPYLVTQADTFHLVVTAYTS
jgi:hypothetical protein